MAMMLWKCRLKVIRIGDKLQLTDMDVHGNVSDMHFGLTVQVLYLHVTHDTIQDLRVPSTHSTGARNLNPKPDSQSLKTLHPEVPTNNPDSDGRTIAKESFRSVQEEHPRYENLRR